MRTIDQLIAETPIFDGMAPAQLEFIAGCGWNDRVPAGTLLLQEGEPANRFYILRHGVVALQFEAPGRGPLVIETLTMVTSSAGPGCLRRTFGRWTDAPSRIAASSRSTAPVYAGNAMPTTSSAIS